MPSQPSDFLNIAANPPGGEDPASYGFGAELQNAMAPSMGMIAPRPQQGYGETELNTALSNMRQFQARIVATQKANDMPQSPTAMSIKETPDGKKVLKVETTPENYQNTMNAAMSWHQALGSYAKQLDSIQGQLAAEEKNIRNQPPWVQLATALSANLAQGKDMPGWVQALGRTAAELNPRAETIQAKRVRVLQDQAAIAEKGAALEEAAARTREVGAGRKEDRLAQAETQRQKLVKEAYDNAAQAIEKGPGQLDVAAARQAIRKAGANDEEAATLLAQLSNLASNVGKKFQTERADKAQAVADAAKKEGRLAAQWLGSNKRLEEQFEGRQAQQEFFSQKVDYNKNTSLSVAEGQTIQSAFNVLNLVDRMDEAKKNASVGPISGRIAYANPYRSGEWQTIRNYADALLLSGLAGKLGSGVSDRDVEVMRGIVPSGKLTKEQFAATEKVLRTVNADNLKRMMELNPNIQTWKTMAPMFEKAGLQDIYVKGIEEMKDKLADSYPALFGPDRSAWAERTYGPDTRAGAGGDATVSTPPAGAKATGGLHGKTTPPKKYPWE